jgi:phenylacetate-coenzyme A ligase PaaK-like adenylate-forming protein
MEMLHRNHWDKFIIQKQPDWMISSIQDALELAKEIESVGGQKIQEVLRKFERGFFWGTELDGEEDHRSKIKKIYGIPEVFSIYLSAECREMYAECTSHDGVHLWMDGVIHEILLQSGKSLFIDQAEPGMEGEYILTRFYESLPLVRYRTGDKIRMVSSNPCECGITHPRVEFLGRIKTIS